MKEKIKGQKILAILSSVYFILLIYNLFAAKFIPSFINLLLFIMTCPVFFARFKERHSIVFTKMKLVFALPIFITLLIFVGQLATGTTTIPAEEQNYIDTVLSKITTDTTKEDAIAILGKPDRDMALKVNWWVRIGSRNSRIGIYFSSSTGKASEIVLDGGTGRFYYRKKLE